MKGQNLPDDHHVIRVVPYARLDKDEDGNPTGVLYSAFQLREDEEGLSVTWMEFFDGTREESLVAAVNAIRASNFKPSKKAGFAIGQVANVKSTCADFEHKIRIIHWPEDDNEAHSELRQYPRDNQELMEKLASDTWSELVLNSSIA